MYLFDLFEDAGKKLVIFDIDDTLVNTRTQVTVRHNGRPVHRLNSHEFTHYKLKPGEEFDFGAFRNAAEFARESRPIVPMIQQLNADIATGNRVVMITARADFDDRDTFLNAFRRWDVDIDRVHVYRAGNDTRPIAVDQKKADIIRRLLANNQFSKAIMYDDSVPNLESFVQLHSEHPGTRFYAWHVDHAGRASEYHRAFRSESINEHNNENDQYVAYDKILIDLCAGIVQHQKQDSDRYGLVAAAVVDPKHRVVKGINHKLASGKRVHAEHAAMANYIKQHGAIPEHSIVVTTLSPCTDDMPDRKGPSCTELLNGSPITRVYAGYRDPSQTHLSHDDFDVVYTQNSKIESVCKQIADCFLKESAYTDPANYRGEGVAEGFPQPGESSGKAKQFDPNAKVQTKEMTLDQILNSVKGIPYVNNVVDDWDAKDYSWGVTKKVIEYAQYLQKNPQSVANLPPLVVIDGQLNDGAHRLSAINLLQKRMDPKNPLWKQVKLKVNFGTSADVASEQGVAEAFDNPYKTKIEKSDYGDVDMLAKLPDGTNLSIMFNNQGDDEWQVEFYRNNSQEVTGEGDAQRVFATVLASMQKFIKKYKPWRLTFSATKLLDPTIYYEPDQPVPNPESRAKLYNRLVQRYATAWGYEEYAEDHGDQITYELTRLKPGMAEGATKIHSDKEPKLTGFSFQQLDSLCESAGSDYVKFDRAIKKNLVLPAWTNTLELYGVYARKLNEVKSKTLAEGTQSDIEQQLFDQLSQRALGNIDSASVGDRVSLLHLATLNIPGHKVVAKLSGFLTPKQIVKIVNTGRFQQLEFADGSRYPEKDGGDIFQQAQTWNMTTLFPSADAASKAFMFYVLEGQKLSDVLDFQTNVEQGVAEGGENFNGIDISMEIQKDDEYVDDEDYDNQVLYVTASSKGKELGHVLFAFDGEYLMPQDLEVEERYRGQGIAQIMYDYVKSKGYKIRRSGQQTDAGAGFWDKHKPGKNIWEQGVAEDSDNNRVSFKVQKGKNKFATTLSIGGNPVGVYQYDANTGRSIAEVYPEFKGKGLGKLLVLHAIYTAAKLGLDFQEDESRTSEYDNVLDSLSSSGYIVDDDGYWYVTGEGEQFLKQSLKQGVAENFADGRNPGRKGLAKRSGVNTKASVSSLRKTARHSTGEKARMAHWLANMKAGRAKKK